MDLTDAQIERYSRQIILPAIGGRGQQRLLETTVCVVGAGPLATITAWYLAAAGVGVLDLCTSTDAALGRLHALREELATLNPDTTVRLGSPSFISPATRGRPRGGSRRRGTGDHHGEDRAAAPGANVLVCADVTAAMLEQMNSVALRRRVPLLAGSGGAQPRIALYAGHDAKHPCAACDPQPPVCEAEAAAPDPAIGLIGSVLALEALKASLGLPGFRPGIGLHYEPQTLTITECPIGKPVTCRACAPGHGCET